MHRGIGDAIRAHEIVMEIVRIILKWSIVANETNWNKFTQIVMAHHHNHHLKIDICNT